MLPNLIIHLHDLCTIIIDQFLCFALWVGVVDPGPRRPLFSPQKSRDKRKIRWIQKIHPLFLETVIKGIN